MRAGTDDRQAMVGMGRELVAIGIGNGGGAQHTDSMRLLTRRLGVPPVAEAVHEACIGPGIMQGPCPVVADRVYETPTIPTFKRDGDENLAGRDELGCVFTVPTYQSDFEALAPAFRR